MILLIDPTGATPTILYVKPTEDTQCPGEPCHTLEWYARNETHSNTIMSFLPGTHNLTTDYNASHISNLTLMATQTDDVIVNCVRQMESFSFMDISNLTIKGLTFSKCYDLVFSNINDLHMFQVEIHNPELQGIRAINLFGNCVFEEINSNNEGGVLIS